MADVTDQEVAELEERTEKLTRDLAAAKDAMEANNRELEQLKQENDITDLDSSGDLDLASLPDEQRKVVEDFQNALDQSKTEIMAEAPAGGKKGGPRKMRRMV